jgi:hypothetical protein
VPYVALHVASYFCLGVVNFSGVARSRSSSSLNMLTRSQSQQNVSGSTSNETAEVSTGVMLPDGNRPAASSLPQPHRDDFATRFTHIETVLAQLTKTLASLSPPPVTSAEPGASTHSAPVPTPTRCYGTGMTAPSPTTRFRDDGNAGNAYTETVPQNSEGIRPPPHDVRCHAYTLTPPLRFRDDNQVNPVEFLTSMERYFRAEAIPAANWIRITISQLEGMPYNWGTAFEDSWLEWGGFRTSFMKMFWSEARQDRIIDELHRSVYDRSVHHSMSEFFLYWVKRVKYLSPPMSTGTFLRRIKHLFPANVESAIIAARVETTEDMLFFLRELDDASARRQDRRVTMIPKSSDNNHPQRPSDRQDRISNYQRKERHQVHTGQWRDCHQGHSGYNDSSASRDTHNGAQRDDASDARTRPRNDADVCESRQTTGNGQ